VGGGGYGLPDQDSKCVDKQEMVQREGRKRGCADEGVCVRHSYSVGDEHGHDMRAGWDGQVRQCCQGAIYSNSIIITRVAV
jgi:hypothetical protein